jgi:C1A family cysteine protease
MYGSLQIPTTDDADAEAPMNAVDEPSFSVVHEKGKYHSMKWKVLGFVVAASCGSLLLFTGSHNMAKSSSLVKMSQLEKRSADTTSAGSADISQSQQVRSGDILSESDPSQVDKSSHQQSSKLVDSGDITDAVELVPGVDIVKLVPDANTKLSVLSKSEKGTLFNTFKQKFGVNYGDTTEELKKFDNFESFLKTVDDMNDAERAAGGTAVHGVTRFADMSADEFKKNFLGFKATGDKTDILKGGKSGSADLVMKRNKLQPEEESTGETNVVSWVDVYTTPVKDQGYCGSCWAFSTIQQIESDAIMRNYLTKDDWLSPQQLISCDTTDLGCDGGVPVYGYEYVKKAGGIVTNSSYPYTSFLDESGTCQSVAQEDLTVTVAGFYFLDNESEMQDYVVTTGPLSVCLDATSWASYTEGILATCTNDPNHCVQIVGINQEEDYWLVRNSWGSSWGENGYIRMKLVSTNEHDVVFL